MIKYIGVDDLDIDLFEGQYEVPAGISYNSYLILDEQVALMDTVDARKTDEWLANLAEALEGRKVDYLVVSHMEPDHASNVARIIDMFPECTVVCGAKVPAMITRFFGVEVPKERIRTVKDGDTLSLGHHVLEFVTAPMVHWPEVIMEYDQTEKVLFAADAFGKFGALSVEDDEGWACEARRYYFNIVGKYGAQVQSLLKKLGGKEIQKICPLHGPVLESDLGYYVGLYNTWSSYEPESEGVFIAHCSLHGNTSKAAEALAEMLRERGVKVAISDLSRDDLHECVEDAFRYDRLVLACPTYDADIMPIMEDFIAHLRMKNYQNRRVAFVENGTWAPMAAKKMREKMEALKKITIVEPAVTIESVLNDKSRAALEVLAEALAS